MSNTDDQRAAFEAWALRHHASIDRMNDIDDPYPGQYKNYSTAMSWLAWQAAIEHAKKTASA